MTQPVLTDLTKTTFDPELSPGAHNAVNTCLRIQPEEKVTLITDNACREIAASIARELLRVWVRRSRRWCWKTSRRAR